jgi:microsomal epoxide hydrolase
MDTAIENWRTNISRRDAEVGMSRYPQFATKIASDEGEEIKTHFMALFFERPDATSIVLLHGWPGSVLEFMLVLDVMKTRYTPATISYHLIVSSLPGFALSPGSLATLDWKTKNTAAVVDGLVQGLDFGAG